MMSVNENSEQKENDYKTSPVRRRDRKTPIILAALVTVVLLVIGVAIIVLFAARRDVSSEKSSVETKSQRLVAQKWDACKNEASQRGLCINRCAAPGATTLPTTITTAFPNTATSPSTRMTSKRLTPTRRTPGIMTPKGVTSDTMTTVSPDSGSIRLPNNLYPLSYDLILHPHIYGGDPDSFFFDGHVTILFRCDHKTDVVVLNSENLTYVDESFSLTHASVPLGIVNVLINKKKKLISFHLDQELKIGEEYKISANFSKDLQDNYHGLFVHGVKQGNKMTYQVGSQLESIFARRIFPCFDEPHFKSVFNVSLIRKSNTASYSNMEIEKTIPLGEDLMMDVYGTTPKMPVYLLAFAVGNFSGKSTTVNGTKMTTWARPDLDGQQEYSVHLAAEMLSALGKYYESPFPMKKLDMLSLTNKPGGMENWGLILMPEIILFDKRLHSGMNQLRLISLVGHEIAHMWFGNLVTMSWWDDIWLNEGFSVYVNHQARSLVKPEWHVFDLFRAVTELGMSQDSYNDSIPVHMPVHEFKDIYKIFSSITYSKAACLVKMMVFFLGEEVFQKGISMYLKKHAYGNANHTDLWCALSDASGQDVEAIMSTWVKQINFPLVHIRKVRKGGNGTTVLELRQQRYSAIPSQQESTKFPSPYGYRWRIPMSIISNSTKFDENNTIMWMHETKNTEMVFLSNALDDNAWILGNPDNNVFCRVNYDESNWRLLINQLKSDHKVFSTVDRTTIVEDACHLARSGYVSVTICLDVLSYMVSERDYPVWKAAIGHLDYFDKILHQHREYSRFSAWVASLVEGTYDNLHKDPLNASIMERVLIDTITGYACRYGNRKCLQKMTSTFAQRMKIKSTYIDPNIIPHVFCYGIKDGAVDQWWAVYDMFNDTMETPLETTILEALACTDQVALLHEYLKLTIEVKMAGPRALKIFQYVSKNPIGRYVVFNFVRDNINVLTKRLDTYVFWTVYYSMTLMTTRTEVDQVLALISARGSKSDNLVSVKNSISKILADIEWWSANREKLGVWLETLPSGR